MWDCWVNRLGEHTVLSVLWVARVVWLTVASWQYQEEESLTFSFAYYQSGHNMDHKDRITTGIIEAKCGASGGSSGHLPAELHYH